MTKTVVVVGDSHFCETSRFDECIRLHREIEGWVTKNNPDLIVHTGDVFDRKSTAREREAVAEWLQDCAQTCPVVLVRGNHDADLDVEFMERLRSTHMIQAFERPATVDIAGVRLCLLPWPRKAQLLAALGSEVSQEQAGQAAQEALRGILRGMRHDVEWPTLFAGHVMVRGSVTSTGQPLVGCDMELGLEDLALVGADAYALGHIHCSQEWRIGGTPCFYPGSPRRTAYGETEDKGFTVVQFDGRIASKRFIKLSAAPMLLATGTYNGTDLVVDQAEFDAKFDEGCEIRLRYTVDSDHQAAAKAAAASIKAKWLDWGAASVQLEPEVNVTTRLRAPEVAKAATLKDQLVAHWSSKNYDPGARRESLLGKLVTLEVESL